MLLLASLHSFCRLLSVQAYIKCIMIIG